MLDVNSGINKTKTLGFVCASCYNNSFEVIRADICRGSGCRLHGQIGCPPSCCVEEMVEPGSRRVCQKHCAITPVNIATQEAN
jgi:hypothetical protein